MILRHYSDKPLGELEHRTQGGVRGYFKPVGLWVSVVGEDDWKCWCEAEDFHLDALKIEHDVALIDGANVLHLSSVSQMFEFHDEFNVSPYVDYPRIRRINWLRVAENWDGIIIAPYQWSQRLEGRCNEWYYQWDCASGCIWHPRAIAHVRVLNTQSECV